MFLLGACSSPSSEPRERLSFNDGWCFSLIDDSLAAQVDFADSGWRKLNYPMTGPSKEISVRIILREQVEVLCLVVSDGIGRRYSSGRK